MRMNISVPDDLRRQMDAVQDSVNWSATACNAFRDKLAQIAQRERKMEMQDVINRLKASKERGDSETFDAGYAIGTEWAQNEAEARDLENLAEAEDRSQPYGVVSDAYQPHCIPGEQVYIAVQPVGWDSENADVRQESGDFWEMIMDSAEEGERARGDLGFIKGFVKGALDVWQKVVDQL